MVDADAFIATCDSSLPEDDGPRLVYADWLEERGNIRAEMLRLVHEKDGLQNRCGSLPPLDAFPQFHNPAADLQPILTGLQRLHEFSQNGSVATTTSLRQQYLTLFATNVPLDPDRLRETLRLHYHLQVALLQSLNLLEKHNKRLGITAIDGRFYSLPSFEHILELFQTNPVLQQKLCQSFDTLLLVPFGLSLERFIETWREGLQRSARRPGSPVATLNQDQPVWPLEGYQQQSLVYNPRRFTAGHGGRTKEQLLREDGRGWDVLLVERTLIDLPPAGQGQTIGGRRQLERGQTPSEYLPALSERKEIGLTPEAYIVQSLAALEHRGQMLDSYTVSFLTGAFFHSSPRYVPSVYWCPDILHRARLGWYHPDGDDPLCGVRAAVRVI